MRLYTIFLSLCCVLLISAASVSANFSAVYIFGDSLSDTGNLASAPGQGDFPPPFFENRVSNGPIAVETLAALLGLEANASFHLLGTAAQGTNYAVAGARAGGIGPIDLSSQVGAFMLNHSNEAPADALYVVFIGGSDVRDVLDDEEMEAQEILNQAVAAIAVNVEMLADVGAANFLVANVPDIGGIPETQRRAESEMQPMLPEIATRRTEVFNEVLEQEVVRLRVEIGVQIALVNLFDINREVLDNATAYGLTNLVDPCFLGFDSVPMFHLECDNGANIDTFAFFDAIHPTKPVHERIGRILFAFAPTPPLAPPAEP